MVRERRSKVDQTWILRKRIYVLNLTLTMIPSVASSCLVSLLQPFWHLSLTCRDVVVTEAVCKKWFVSMLIRRYKIKNVLVNESVVCLFFIFLFG